MFFANVVNRSEARLRNDEWARKVAVLSSVLILIGGVAMTVGDSNLSSIAFMQLPFICIAAYIIRFSLVVLEPSSLPNGSDLTYEKTKTTLTDYGENQLHLLNIYRSCYRFWGCVIGLAVICFYVTHRGFGRAVPIELSLTQKYLFESLIIPAICCYVLLPHFVRLWTATTAEVQRE